jgi:lysophospholipase L1-like esterase
MSRRAIHATRLARAASCVAAALVFSAASGFAQGSAGGQHWIATWGTAQQLVRPPAGPGAGRGQGTGAAPAASGSPSAADTPPLPSPTAPPAAQPAGPGPSGAPARRFGIPPAVGAINDQTIRMIVRTSAGGSSVRIRVSNAFGATSVAIGAAHIALRGSESAIVAASDRVLTFGGRPAANLYAGQTLISDPVTLTVPPLTDLAVSLYIAGDAGIPASHTFGLRPTYVSVAGNYTAAPVIEKIAATTQSYYWLAGVDVRAAADASTLVTFGDSITDGDQSTPDTNRMWPAVLAGRMQGNGATRNIGVVNAGIAGNRVFGDNNSGLARFYEHALAVPGVKWITLLEGINDITAATRQLAAAQTGAAQAAGAPLSAEDLIAAYRQMIELAHAHEVKVIGCTITPYGGSSGFRDQGEAIRVAVNEWIRKSGAFDAVVDFDAATRDPANPQRFRVEADSPDLLHPGDGGYRLMADAFDLRIFAARRR